MTPSGSPSDAPTVERHGPEADELVRVQRRLHAIFEAPSVGIGIVDRARRWKEANARLCEMLGYSREELAARTWMEVTHPDDLERDVAGATAMLAGERPAYVTEKRYVRKDGSTLWTLVSASPMRGADGEVDAVLVIVQDVGAKRRAEEALRAAYREMDAHVTGSPLAVVQWGSDFRVTRFSQRAEEMFGWKADEVLGRRIDEVPWIPEEDWPKVRAVMEDMAKGARPSNVNANRNVRKDGRVIHCEWYNSSLYDEQGRLASVFSRVLDVTEREQAREALARSEARFRALAEEMPVGVFQVDLAGSCVYLNHAGAEIFGLAPGEGVGRPWLDAFHPDDAPRFVAAWRAFLGREGAFASEVRMGGRNGRTRHVRVHARRIFDAGGAVTGYVGALVDLTDERELQARLAAASRLAGLGTLAAGMAHEMNSPLAASLASQAFAAEELRVLDARADPAAGTDDIRRVHAECVEALDDSIEATRRIAQIVQTMTTLGRADRPRGRAKVSKVIEEALAWLPKGPTRDVAIEVRAAPDLEVEGVVSQLGQVLTRLVANALQAIPPGRKGRVEIRAGRAGDGQVRIEVADDGVGIPAKDLGRLFDPFFTTRPVGQGMGLGLPVCNAIVTAHGGSIAAASEPGRGTTFTLLLPAP